MPTQVLRKEILTEVSASDIDQLIEGSTPAARAAELLGYRAKRDAMKANGGNPNALRNLLARQKIAVLTEESVKKYQREKVRRSAAAYGVVESLANFTGPDKESLGSRGIITMLSALCFFVIGLFVELVKFGLAAEPTLQIAGPFCILGMLIGVAPALPSWIIGLVPGLRNALGAWLQQKAYDSPELSWKEVALENYSSENIPDSVLMTAIRIKELFPDVKYTVLRTEELRVVQVRKMWTERAEMAKRHPDPFLVASFGNERFFIGYWDEKGFVPRYLQS